MDPSVPKETRYFELVHGRYPALEDLNDIKDRVTRTRLKHRIDRASRGNYGPHRRFGDLIELIADFGPGYRVYLGEEGAILIVILVVGDKSTQSSDFKEARAYWSAHKARKAEE